MSRTWPCLPVGVSLRHCVETGSTNDDAKALAVAGGADLTLIWADRQTRGRGRRGRAWESLPGNLLASLILRPNATPEVGLQLGFAVSVSLCETLDGFLPPGGPSQAKWPNDILVGGRKIAGILLESGIVENRLSWLVAGVGLNLVNHPADSEYPATDLAVSGRRMSPGDFLEAWLPRLLGWRHRWQTEGFDPLRAAWLARAAGLGQDLRVRLATRELTGRFETLDTSGRLILAGPDGPAHIAVGDVFPSVPA